MVTSDEFSTRRTRRENHWGRRFRFGNVNKIYDSSYVYQTQKTFDFILNLSRLFTRRG